MRRGINNAVDLTDDGKLRIICLGADHVAEHEWGIEDLLRDFDVNPDLSRENLGVQRRQVRQVPNGLALIRDLEFQPHRMKSFKVDVLYYDPYARFTNRDRTDEIPSELTPREDWETDEWEPLAGAWSGRDFGISACDDPHRGYLGELAEAFDANDVAIWVGKGHAFQNGGLCLGIVSRLTEEFLQEMHDVDLDAIRLNEADMKTGIKQRLHQAGEKAGGSSWNRPFEYFALSPKWASEIKSTKNGRFETEHDVIYWLNPMDQKNNNFGWYTVEELDAWIRGEGPVPKKEAA